jgi:TolB-like protein/Tfp pilus assembly protein PilF
MFDELKRRNVVRWAVAYLTAAWLLAQLVTVLGDLVALPAWVGPVVLIVLGTGFIIVVVLAWFYDLTEQGLRTEAEIKSDPLLKRLSHRYLDYAIIALLAIALGYFIWESRFRAGPEVDSAIVSVAVMPFDDLSPARDQSWFAEGMTAELMNALVRIPGLSIAGRRSVEHFDASRQSLSQFADSIGVSHVLEGSVRTANGRVRVSAQLVRAGDGFNVWSDVYDEQLTDVFEIQDRIAQGVIDGLQVHFLASGRTSSIASMEAGTDFDSYKLYLQGRYHLSRRSRDDLEQAVSFFKQSLEAEPQRSRTHSALAATYAVMPYYGISDVTGALAAAARYHAETALKSDSGNAEAYSILGMLHMIHDRDWSKARAAFEKAYELAPGSADIANLYGDFFYVIGDYVSAEHMEGIAARLDPLSAVNQLELGLVFSFRGEFDKAISQSELAIELDRSLPNAWWQLFRGNILADNPDVAASILEKHADELGAKNVAEAGAWLAAYEQRHEDLLGIADNAASHLNIGPTALALIYALAQDGDSAARYINQAYESHDAILVSPMYFYLPEDWKDLPEVQDALDKDGLKELFELRRTFIARETGRKIAGRNSLQGSKQLIDSPDH